MKTVKKYAGMTAQQIIDGKDGETNGGHNMTGNIMWQYRTDVTPEGFVSDTWTACEADRATMITIESTGGIGPRLNIA